MKAIMANKYGNKSVRSFSTKPVTKEFLSVSALFIGEPINPTT